MKQFSRSGRSCNSRKHQEYKYILENEDIPFDIYDLIVSNILPTKYQDRNGIAMSPWSANTLTTFQSTDNTIITEQIDVHVAGISTEVSVVRRGGH
jgi:hypothetical protein